ncbi:MAG: DNA-binding response regulator [Gallionellales bacterium RIFCSPLOWO2_12_FULL_59_22]|nr:MAG: DNA-binding response regulator [Gallionellales bacterium RIFCSPLOWO2_02_FULL_59_110]OGT05691.1 MAG: DNA-binding response regulator [Gallionellales bacterium RIFCSPLOWO2_02_58_13]OGT14653.1 MAG: DNA-binding response regulator [Gallionellales bacterium RIFCSPLOWO2_12_FULL_59_22]
MIRIMIVDDHAIVRQGLKKILEESGKMKVVAEHANGADALRWICANDCDVVLLDIAMPGRSGIDVLKQLREEKPKLPVLILSIYPEDQYAVRLIKAGAAGYLTKESAPEVVTGAVRRVASGNKYISPAAAEMLAVEFGAPDDKLPHETLSDREFQIFRLLASARTVSEIADILALSVKTVSTYRTRILGKMRLRNNAELMRYAAEKHLME